MQGPVVTRESFSVAPVKLLEQCKSRKGTLFVYLWLWHYAGTSDEAWPSVTTQAEECRMTVEDVREARRWLVENGWITRIERPGKSTIFKVRFESQELPPTHQNPSPSVWGTPGGKPTPDPSPKTGGRTRTLEQEIKQNPPIIPKTTKSSGKGKLVLPEWLEPCRQEIEQWLKNRKKAHPKHEIGITATSLKGLEYARRLGVLKEYCVYASERNWISLGFVGHQELIDKLAGRNSRNNGRNSTTNPVVYTLT